MADQSHDAKAVEDPELGRESGHGSRSTAHTARDTADTGTSCRDQRSHWLASLQVQAQMLRRTPSICIVPLAVLIICLGLGLWGVVSYAALDADHTRDRVESEVEVLASTIRQTLESSYVLISIMDTLAMVFPDKQHWDGLFSLTAKNAVDQMPFGLAQAVRAVYVSPAGTIQYLYNTTAYPDFRGVDLLQADPDQAAYVRYELEKLRGSNAAHASSKEQQRLRVSDVFKIQGPVPSHMGRPVTAWGTSRVYLPLSKGPPESWGYDMSSLNAFPDLANGSQGYLFWGSVVTDLNLEVLLESTGLQALTSREYRWSLWNEGSTSGFYSIPRHVIASSQQHTWHERWEAYAAGPMTSDGLHDPECYHMQLSPSNTWELCVEPEGGWTPAWAKPLIATVVLVSVVFALLLLGLLLSRQQHKVLLEAVVPKAVISQLVREGDVFKALGPKAAVTQLEESTPAGVMLSCVNGLLEQQKPSTHDLLFIRTALLQAWDLYAPPGGWLEEQMAAQHLDQDVTLNLMQTLGGRMPNSRLSSNSQGRRKSAASLHHTAASGIGGNSHRKAPRQQRSMRDVRHRVSADTAEEHSLPLKSMGSGRVRFSLDLLPPLASGTHTSNTATSLSLLAGDLEGSETMSDASITPHTLAEFRLQDAFSMLIMSAPSITTSAAVTATSAAMTVQGPAAATASPAHGPPSPLATRVSSEITLMTAARSGGHGHGMHSGPSPLRLSAEAEGDAADHTSPGGVMGITFQAPQPCQGIMEEVERLLGAAVSGWTFDMFALADATLGHPVSTLAYYLLVQETRLAGLFQLDLRALARQMRTIEAGYRRNPYHNSIHAASVLRSMHVLLTRSGMKPHYADDLTQLSAYVAAAVHDYQHVGLTNDFLVQTSHPLAMLYNDRAPQENHHAAASLTLLLGSGGVLSTLPRSNKEKLRKTIIELVLATDMKQHLAITSHFTTLWSHGRSGLASQGSGAGSGAGPGSIAATAAGAHPLTGNAVAPAPPSTQSIVPEGPGADGAATAGATAMVLGGLSMVEPVKPKDEAERMLSLQVAIKIADLGHMAESTEVHKRWVMCLEEELFQQGDSEKAAGLPVSPLFDRDKPGVSKSQTGFFDFAVMPLFGAFTKAFPGCRPLMGLVEANYRFWQGNAPARPSAEETSPASQQHAHAVPPSPGRAQLQAAKGGHEASSAGAADGVGLQQGHAASAPGVSNDGRGSGNKSNGAPGR